MKKEEGGNSGITTQGGKQTKRIKRPKTKSQRKEI